MEKSAKGPPLGADRGWSILKSGREAAHRFFARANSEFAGEGLGEDGGHEGAEFGGGHEPSTALRMSLHMTPRIQPSTWALLRSCGSSAGLKNRWSESFMSARRSQEATA